jgi:hypothetical protein
MDLLRNRSKASIKVDDLQRSEWFENKENIRTKTYSFAGPQWCGAQVKWKIHSPIQTTTLNTRHTGNTGSALKSPQNLTAAGVKGIHRSGWIGESNINNAICNGYGTHGFKSQNKIETYSLRWPSNLPWALESWFGAGRCHNTSPTK